jgi:hypothetical protein
MTLVLLCGLLPTALAAAGDVTDLSDLQKQLTITNGSPKVNGLDIVFGSDASSFTGETGDQTHDPADELDATKITISAAAFSDGTSRSWKAVCSYELQVTLQCTTCGATKTGTVAATNVHEYDYTTAKASVSNEAMHTVTCKNCSKTIDEYCSLATGAVATVSSDGLSHSFTCQYCKRTVTNATHIAKAGSYTSDNTKTHNYTCDICNAIVTEAHDEDGTCEKCGYDSDLELRFLVDDETLKTSTNTTGTDPRQNPILAESIQYGGELTLTVKAYVYGGTVDVTNEFNTPSFKWNTVTTAAANVLSQGSSDATNYFNSYQSRSTTPYPVYCDVTVTPKDTSSTSNLLAYKDGISGRVTWNVTITSDFSVSATVYAPNSLSFSSVDDLGSTAVMEQIYNAIHSDSDDPYLVYIELENASDYTQSGGKLTVEDRKESDGQPTYFYYDAGDIPSTESKTAVPLSDVSFVPGDSFTDGETVTFFFWATTRSEGTTTTKAQKGCITFTVKDGGSGLGILHTAESGSNVVLDSARFEQFWLDNYEDGTLQYITFNSVSSGSLYNNYAAGSKEWKNVVSQKTLCYLDPANNQTGLDDLTYVPKNADTVSATISFTAKGKTGVGSATAERTGVVTILYSKAAVDSIDYTIATGTATNMVATDFDTIYKAVTATTTTPSYKIKFLDVPSHGTLYANYTVNTTNGKITGIALTSRNVNAFEFNNRATGSAGIGKVAYVPDTTGAGDTLTYAVFKSSDNTLQYIGTVNLGIQTATLSVSYTTGATGVAFKASDFYATTTTTADGTRSTLADTQLITFTLPTSGVLYRGGVAVASGDKFAATADTANGVYSINDVTYVPAVASGSVEIPFTAQASSGGSKATGTVTITISSKTFSDVATSHWAYSYISRLASEGVVDGYPDGSFGPNNAVTYGQALKMILLAAGYPTQTEPSGNNWASNYIRLAYSYGIISNSNVDATAIVTRDEIAEIAAKAMNLQPATAVTNGTAPSDSTDGYVYALYNAGIVEGNNGRWNGSSSFVRMELAKVICNIMDYVAK